MRLFNNIPCVVYIVELHTPETQGYIKDPSEWRKQIVVANTMTYWGAKRLKAKIEEVRPELSVGILEVWHHPDLRRK